MKWILRTCWLKKDLLQPQLVSGLKIRPWQWLPGRLPPSCRQYPLSTGYCCSGQVPCACAGAYLLFRLPQVTLRGMQTQQAAPCWPSLAPPLMFPSQVILTPMVKPVSVFNAISHLRIVWFSVCFHFSGPFNYLYISCTFVSSSLYRIKNNIKIRRLKYNLISYHNNLCKLCHQRLFRHHMKKY